MDSAAQPVQPKGARIRAILAANPGQVTARELAKQINCTSALIYRIANTEGLQLKPDQRKVRAPSFMRMRSASNASLEKLKAELSRLPESRVEFVPIPEKPAALREPAPQKTPKEDRLRLELARQLEEILARQQRIWGPLMM